MMPDLSPEQTAICDNHGPLSVVACAGSGKTRTAVRRLADMQGKTVGGRVRLALLSFSNTAVDTFRADYRKVLEQRPALSHLSPVEIDTVDSFITGLILRPHAHRTMQAPRSAFLVTGSEPFLNGFNFYDGTRNQPVKSLVHGRVGGADQFRFRNGYVMTDVNTADAIKAVTRLGKTGAYTHDLGRYWAYRTLVENPAITAALARRYPYIIIDEAQDIGSTQEAIFDLLIQAGSQLSLIGDANQAIFEFAGATGEFLARHGNREGVTSCGLTVNFRSVPRIVAVANALTARNDTAARPPPPELNGAFFVGYAPNDPPKLVETFRNMIATAGIQDSNSVVVCRSTNLVKKFGGADEPVGRGTVKGLAEASILRDQMGNYPQAFKIALRCVVALLADGHGDVVSRVLRGDREAAAVRRRIWSFVRDADSGLPHGSLLAITEWHPKLVKNVKALLEDFKADHGLEPCATVGQRLNKTDLPDKPLYRKPDLAAPGVVALRTDTVHQLKGESIDAVLYVASTAHATDMLAGVATEEGRIGYVALTRARNLFLLGVPQNALAGLRPNLLERGFVEAGA